MRSLFARVMIGSLMAVVVFAAVTAIAIGSSLNLSLDSWTRAREADIQRDIETTLRRTFARRARPTPVEIAEALDIQLRPGIYVVVFDAQMQPLFVYRPDTPSLLRGEAPEQPLMPGFDPTAGRHRGMMGMPGRGGQGRPPELEDLQPIRINDEVRGFFAAGSQGFAADTANMRLIRSVLVAVLAGGGAALLLSLGVSYLFSRRLASETGALAAGLRELQSGNRAVVFQTKGTVELADIAHSADSLQRELDHQEALRRQWAQDVAHDLRTPVAALRSQLEAMADGVLQATSERLTRTLSELGRLESLIADLRTLTQLESPELELNLRPVSVAPLVSESVERFRLIAAERGIDIRTELEGATVEGDADKLDRALSNLIGNAVQYSPDGSTVLVRSRAPRAAGSPASIEIENPGAVPEQELPRLFDRLYRGEKSRSSNGSGLGLTIALEIVKRHGGTITISNDAGPRVRVVLALPA